MATATSEQILELLCATDGAAEDLPPAAIVVAHPDDEVVSAGSRLPMLRGAHYIHVTDGAPREGSDARAHGFRSWQEYAGARRRELRAALALAGVAEDQLHELHCPDQEAAFRIAHLAREIADLLSALRPGMILTHAYEGGHPDHDATAVAVHAARRLLSRQGGTAAPALLEMASYRAGPAGMVAYEFLPAPDVQSCQVYLTEAQQLLKIRMLECFTTQQATLVYFPPTVERFRTAPKYDFTQPAHQGTLYYEQFQWGVTGPQQFCALAEAALGRLGIGGTA